MISIKIIRNTVISLCFICICYQGVYLIISSDSLSMALKMVINLKFLV